MTRMGMRELKENMGRFVSLIKKNETITLHYRGKPLATVHPIHAKETSSSAEQKLIADLERQGLISGGSGKGFKKIRPIKVKGKSISDIVIEDREE